MSKQVEQLLELAQAEFGQISAVEERLIRAVAKGETADYTTGSQEIDDLTNSNAWGDDRTLQSDRLIWLCTEPQAKELITFRGINLSGIKIQGEFNIEFARIDFPLSFSKCVFTHPILLRQAKLPRLAFEGSHVLAVNAISIRIDGGLVLSKGFQSNGGVDLAGSIISGNINCEGSKFINPQGDALRLERVNVSHSILLRDGFESEGSIQLYRATIGGDLDCQGSNFITGQGDAIKAEGVDIKGNVLLRKGFKADAGVIFYRSNIGGNFDCQNGKFVKRDRYAISLEGAKIGGSVFMRKNHQAGSNQTQEFSSEGLVRLYRATIGGVLDCQGSKFVNGQGDAIDASWIDVKGNVILSNGFEADGGVTLYGAIIGGNFECQNGKFVKRDGYAISLEGAKVAGCVFLRKNHQVLSNQTQGFQAEGLVRLFGATIGKDLLCDGGKFINGQGDAIDASLIDVKGNILFRNGFEAEGRVSLRSAKIDGVLEMNGIRNPEKMFVDLRFAKIRTLHDAEDSWTQKGKTDLNDCVYDTISHSSPLDSKRRLKWLRLQLQENRFSPQPYEQLAKVLRSLGHENAAIEVLVAKQEDRRRYGNMSLMGRLWNHFLGITIAHGYQPHRALLFALAFVLLGGFIFAEGYSQDLISPSKFETKVPTTTSISSQIPKEYPKFNAFVYSLDLFLPIVDLRQKSYWQPNSKTGSEILTTLVYIQWGSVVQYYFWMHILLGWFLTTLWVAGFTGLVRRVN